MRVYFTVDTESSIGGAWENPQRKPVPASRHVFCRIGAQEFGIPLITRMLHAYGLRGTFFVETLATRCLGERDTSSVFEFLLKNRQDVQLHIHPVFRIYADAQAAIRAGRQAPTPQDFIGRFSPAMQADFIGEAISLFETFAGCSPTAFRAGCFAGSRSLLRTLHAFGLRLDSSFNPCYPTISFPGEQLQPNLVTEIEGVWEFPINVAVSPLPESYGGFKFADCTSLSFRELRSMLEAARLAGQQHFTVVFHSFSAVKSSDLSFSRLRPNHVVIRRLERLFRYLADHPERFQVDTMGNAARFLDDLPFQRQIATVYHIGLAHALARKTVQVFNHWF